MDITQQYQTICRMLAQKMMRHADQVLRQWARQLQNFEYFDRLSSLNQNYDYTFSFYLATPVHYEGDPAGAMDDDRDTILSDMTRQYYQLTDEMYADLLLLNGRVPKMLGFGRDNRDSVLNYFSQCVRLRDEDLNWLLQIADEHDSSALAILATSAMALNLRVNGFQYEAFRNLIDLSMVSNTIVAEQALAQLILLCAVYDVRLDFYPELQEAIEQAVGEGERAFAALLAIVDSAKPKHDMLEPEMIDALPEEIYQVLDADADTIEQKMDAEMERAQPFINEIVNILPGTWVFGVIVTNDTQREQMAKIYAEQLRNEAAFEGILMGRQDLIHDPELRADYSLYNELYEEALEQYLAIEEKGYSSARIRFRIGWCALMVGDLEKAEQYMVARLREEHTWVEDYLNYAHLCFIKGDKVSAFEFYKQARERAGSAKRFKSTFCPDRRVLVDMGIPLQEVYLMEDRLL